ncbi:ABC transporter substrate-binding protein [Oxalobacter sp. OttesenSCG-928-P03]|nr:ABC transporter substrate-binding protein [Oxalobacter sp. OttesenSCG-928-P03]
MKMTALKRWFVFVLASAAFAFSTQALAQEAPDELVKRVSADVLDVAKKDREVKKGNMQQIFRLVEEKVMPYVDFKKTTSLAVGKYWRQATPEQRNELTKQFHDLLFYTYASAISKVEDGHKLQFQPLRAKADATDVIVNSRIIQPKNPEPILIGYRLEKQADGWKIYDINVMGAWLVETYKTTFTNEIGRSGIDGLIKTLKDKNASLARGGKPAQ